MKIPKRFTLHSLLVLLALAGIALGLIVNWHRSSMGQFRAINELRSIAPTPMIYFDQMICWNEQRAMYTINDGDALSLPPEGFSKLLCRFFDPDYACRPRLLVFIDNPDSDTIGIVKQLPTVRQIVFVNGTRSVREKWKQELPSKSIMSWSEFRDDSPSMNAR